MGLTDIPKPRLVIVFLDYILELDKPGRIGLSDVVWDMASELVELGHDVHVVGPYAQELVPDQRVRVHTIKVPPTGYRWFVGHLWICLRMARVAHQLSPDIVHAPEYVSTAVYNSLFRSEVADGAPSRMRALVDRFAGTVSSAPSKTNRSIRVLTVPGNIFQRLAAGKPLAPAKKKSALCVLTVPGNIFHKLQHQSGNPYSFFYTQCLKWAARKTATTGTRVIATSHEMVQAWHETGSPEELIYEIPYGVDPRRFYEVPGAKATLHIPEDSTLLLYVGRLSREKAVVELVETVERCKVELRKGRVKVQMFGKGPQTKAVAATIGKTGVGDIVSQSDWLAQSDLSVWYSAADALLLPSYAEGFGRVIPEAMICGTPVIGSRIAGAKDHVVPGRSGYLFDAGDFGGLAQILRQVAADPGALRDLRPFTKQYAMDNLSWSSVVRKIAETVYYPGTRTIRENSSTDER